MKKEIQPKDETQDTKTFYRPDPKRVYSWTVIVKDLEFIRYLDNLFNKQGEP